MIESNKLTNIVSGNDLQECILDTLKTVNDSIASSFGPYGSTSLIKEGNSHTFSKDGFTILKNLRFGGQMESTILNVIHEVAKNVVKEVGDGSTSSIIASYNIYKELASSSSSISHLRPVALFKLFNEAKELIFTVLDSMVLDIACLDDISRKEYYVNKVATIALNNDAELAAHVVAAYKSIDFNGYVDHKQARGSEFSTFKENGFVTDSGYVDASFINTDTGTVEFENPVVIMFDGTVTGTNYVSFLEAIILSAVGQQIPVVIIAPDFGVDARKVLMNYYAYATGNVNFINIVQVPNGTDYTQAKFEDLAVLLNTKPIRISAQEDGFEELIMTISDKSFVKLTHDRFGKCGRIVSDAEKTRFIEPSGLGTDEFNKRIELIKQMIANAKNTSEVDVNEVSRLEGRYAKYTNAHCTLYVGGITEAEKSANMYLVEDAILAVNAALKYGVVKGSNIAIPIAIKDILADRQDTIIKENIDLYYALDIIDKSFKMINIKLINSIPTLKFNEADDIFEAVIGSGVPYNLITRRLDVNVINSVKTDKTILEAALSIVMMLKSTNQFLLQSPNDNIYALKNSLKK